MRTRLFLTIQPLFDTIFQSFLQPSFHRFAQRLLLLGSRFALANDVSSMPKVDGKAVKGNGRKPNSHSVIVGEINTPKCNTPKAILQTCQIHTDCFKFFRVAISWSTWGFCFDLEPSIDVTLEHTTSTLFEMPHLVDSLMGVKVNSKRGFPQFSVRRHQTVLQGCPGIGPKVASSHVWLASVAQCFNHLQRTAVSSC